MTRGQRKQMEDSSRGVFDLRSEPVFIKISSNTSAFWSSLNAQYLRWPKKYGQSRWLAYLEHLVRGNSRLRLGGMEQLPCPSLLVSLRWCRNLTLLSFRRRSVGKSANRKNRAVFLIAEALQALLPSYWSGSGWWAQLPWCQSFPQSETARCIQERSRIFPMRNWKYGITQEMLDTFPHLRRRPRISGTRIMRLHPRSLLTMTSPWPWLVFFPQDFWLCQQISVFFSFPPSLSRTRWIRSVWSPLTLRPRWGTGDLGNRGGLKMTRWSTLWL